VDPDVTRAAQTLADHALVFLVLAIAIIGLALGALVLAVRLARRHQAHLIELWTWVFNLACLVPGARRALGALRRVVPSTYVAIHLLLGLVATAAVIGFAVIAEEVMAGSTVAEFDRAFAEALHKEASPFGREAFRRITWFGSGIVLAIAASVIAVILLLRRRHVLATGWIIAQAGAGLLVITLKSAFARNRPALPDAELLTSWSFPSGHALGTFVFCGMSAYLLLRLTRSLALSSLLVALALTWCIVMGFTRLYLGVHFASDVIAGLIAATAWVAVCISGIELGLRQRSGR
jgi:membrane-associated phospholipid phosphatase